MISHQNVLPENLIRGKDKKKALSGTINGAVGAHAMFYCKAHFRR